MRFGANSTSTTTARWQRSLGAPSSPRTSRQRTSRSGKDRSSRSSPTSRNRSDSTTSSPIAPTLTYSKCSSWNRPLSRLKTSPPFGACKLWHGKPLELPQPSRSLITSPRCSTKPRFMTTRTIPVPPVLVQTPDDVHTRLRSNLTMGPTNSLTTHHSRTTCTTLNLTSILMSKPCWKSIKLIADHPVSHAKS